MSQGTYYSAVNCGATVAAVFPLERLRWFATELLLCSSLKRRRIRIGLLVVVGVLMKAFTNVPLKADVQPA